MMNKFRNATNTRYLKGLFFEMVGADKETVLYTLKDVDHEGFPSLYLLYMKSKDITEHTFANTYLDGWEHWTILCGCSWFKPFIERWRIEKEQKHKATLLAHLMVDAQSGSSTSTSSAKYLIDKGWAKEGKKGRPTKSDIRQEAHLIAKDKSLVEEDHNRILQFKYKSPK